MHEISFEDTPADCHQGNSGKSSIHPVIDGYMGRIQEWLVRMLVDQGVLYNNEFRMPEAGAEVDALFPLDVPDTDRSRTVMKIHESLTSNPAPISGMLADNIRLLCNDLKLSPVEADLLGFLVTYRAIGLFERIADLAFGRIDMAGFAWRMSTVTGHSPQDIETALHPGSALVTSGLIRLVMPNGFGRAPSIDALVEINQEGMRLLTSSKLRMTDLLDSAARPIAPGALTKRDFDFMAEQRDLALDFLQALRHNGKASSILFDGSAGVGKTAFARFVASELNFNGFEIKELDRDGNAASMGERLQLYTLTQKLISLGDSNGLIIFDEADAIFATDLTSAMQRQRPTKAALIRCLETVQVPTIWITNHAEEMDPALLRRFDLVLRFRTLPAHARFEMLKDQLSNDVKQIPKVRSLCANKASTPARIEQATRVAKLIAEDHADRKTEVFCKVMEENLGLRRNEVSSLSRSARLPYRPDAINASEDLSLLTAALKKRAQARICLHGPPGTGKTRYVQHLADQCGLQLAEYRASDLLSRYLGDSEKNIRNMFDACQEGNSLLLLDEADSLLRSRKNAQYNFEVNQVNELLKGLEYFDGLFVASTNLMCSIDAAVLRRLDLKIRFDWLLPDQRWRLFIDLANTLGVSPRGLSARRLRKRVDNIEFLTPGDFAVVARRLHLQKSPAHGNELVDLLEQEVAHKPEAQSNARSIGFTAALGDDR